MKPPPVVDGIRVLSYSAIKPPVTYSGHSFLFVGGREVGPVPRLIIGEDLRSGDIVILHCDKRWNVVGIAGGYGSATQAKERSERIYPGIKNTWIKCTISKAEAVAHERKQWKGQECSFCGRIPPDFEMWVQAKTATICNLCITKYNEDFSRYEE